LFSFLAFWQRGVVSIILFMITAGVSLFVGFYWYDTYVNPLGLAISLCLFAYAALCVGLGLRQIWSGVGEEEE